jgi:hypothetical protein
MNKPRKVPKKHRPYKVGQLVPWGGDCRDTITDEPVQPNPRSLEALSALVHKLASLARRKKLN